MCSSDLLQGRTDRLQANEQPLPEVGNALWVRWNERQLRTSGQRFPQSHPWMKAERLGGERDLTHLLGTTRLWRERGRPLEQLGAIAGGDREGKARDENTDDHDANICSHRLRMDTPQGALYARIVLYQRGNSQMGEQNMANQVLADF